MNAVRSVYTYSDADVYCPNRDIKKCQTLARYRFSDCGKWKGYAVIYPENRILVRSMWRTYQAEESNRYAIQPARS